MKETKTNLIVIFFILIVSTNLSYSKESNIINNPIFFLFNKAQLKHGADIDKDYIDNLLSEMGEKLTEEHPLSVPVSLIKKDVIPTLGQQIWGFFYSDEHGLYVSPIKISTVTGYQAQSVELDGNSISFQTNEDRNASDMGAIWVLCPQNGGVGLESVSKLSLNDINKFISRLPKSYIPVDQKIKNPIKLNKDDLLEHKLELAIKIGNFSILEFIKIEDPSTSVDKVCFIDLGKKIVVFKDCLFLNILDIRKDKYFIVDDTNWNAGQLSVYKMNGEKFVLVKRDGFSKD
jgi:hypothetical protein